MAHRLVAKAEDDISDIWHYVAKESGNVDIADRLIDSITQRFHFLSNQPYSGRTRDELKPGLRSFPVGQYVIFYRVLLADVLILRVMHGRRDIYSALEQ
jgi:toxin ParE1/3/4